MPAHRRVERAPLLLEPVALVGTALVVAPRVGDRVGHVEQHDDVRRETSVATALSCSTMSTPRPRTTPW